MNMRLNTLKPAIGAKKRRVRVGRGIGSGVGKTCGRGHKGQHSRAGGYHKVGFEGGQMPLQRRVPKFGFTSRIAGKTAQVRLSELEKMKAEIIDLCVLKAENVVPLRTVRAKVFASGNIKKSVTLKGLPVSKGARAAIEAVGGKIED